MQNKVRALDLLKSKITLLEREEQLKKLDDIRGEQVEAGWGRQIRSYVMQPCLLYTSPSPRDRTRSRMPSSA